MGKYLVHIAIILLAVSAGCEPLDIGIEARRHGEPSGERTSGREKPQVTKADTFVYVSGVEFPESYDWATDSAFGNVSSKLVLFRDGVRVCEIPAGPGTVFSADPDMHRIAGGHLWTDGLSGNRTVICSDGRERFRFKGRESICSFVLNGEDVLTLGSARDGPGVFYRRNGDLVFSDEKGRCISPLYRDGGRWYFAYRRTVGEAASIARDEYFMVEDGISLPVEVPSDAEKVFDMRMIGGTLYMVISVKGSSVGPYLVQGGGRTAMGSAGRIPLDCSIIPRSGDIWVRGHVKDGKGTVYATLWSKSKVIANRPGVGSCIVPLGEDYLVVSNDGRSGLSISGSRIGNLTAPPPSKFFTDGGSFCRGGRVLLAWTQCGKGSFVWDGGEVGNLEINGFLTGVSLWP